VILRGSQRRLVVASTGLALALVVSAAGIAVAAHQHEQAKEALRLSTSDAGGDVTVTATASPTPEPSPLPTASPRPLVALPSPPSIPPLPSPQPPRPFPTFAGSVLPEVAIGFNGMFYILPGLNIPMPVDPASTDSARVSCSPGTQQIAPGTQGMLSCTVTSQNGFAGTLTTSCQQLVHDGSNLSSQVATDCSVPPSLVLKTGATVSVPVTLSATSEQSGGTYYLALYFKGAELQAPNDFQYSVPPPAQPVVQLHPSCQLVTETTTVSLAFPLTVLVGECSPGITGGTSLSLPMTVGYATVTPPQGVATPVPLLAGLGASQDDVTAQANSSQWITLATLNQTDGSSANFWFAIRLDFLDPGNWQFPIQVGVGPATATTTVSFTLGSNRMVAGIG
jgi:hypothetical protein